MYTKPYTGTGRWTRLAWPRRARDEPGTEGPEANRREKERGVMSAPGAASKGTRLLGCLLRADPQVHERVAPVLLHPVAPATPLLLLKHIFRQSVTHSTEFTLI